MKTTMKKDTTVSTHVFLFSAAIIPAISPIGMDIIKEKIFNTTVGGILVAISSNTSAPGLILTDVPKFKSVTIPFRK